LSLTRQDDGPDRPREIVAVGAEFHGSRRRDADAIAIPGDYQARALTSPWAAQRFWHSAKLRLIDRIAPARAASRVADAGCGSGTIAAHLARSARSVIGFDTNSSAVAYATATYGSSTLRFVLGTFDRLLDEGPFDQIYCLEVLEHMYAEQAVDTLRLFANAARPGAELFVTTPNQRSAWPLIEWSLDRLELVPTLDEAQHLTCFTRQSLRTALVSAGWHVDEIGTFNGIAPFIAGLGERAALGIERLEFAARRALPLNLLYARATVAG
jgi:2-polyprenyl-3-methyl-5-hydroxy-6-metoxy-1,4-benzoquinol methylase